MLNAFLNYILFRFNRAKKASEGLIKNLDSELTEEFLKLLLMAMKLIFLINKEFRRNIDDFQGRYLFKSRDNGIIVSTIFKNGKMKVLEKQIDNPDITVNFRDAKALRNYILSPKPDILGSLLRQDVVPDGNLNFLYKFAFMAKRLQLMAKGEA